jgi:phosphoglycolate phosphatase
VVALAQGPEELMADRERILVLFDIDGTLIQTARAGQRGLEAAVEALHGRSKALEGIPVAGRTDCAILQDVFTRLELTWEPATVDAVRNSYFGHLARELARPYSPPPADFGVLPGVEAVLSAMERDPTFVVALLTGNFERGASIKLGHFGLWDRFRFGAFGDEHVNRRDLVPIARARAEAAGVRASVVVVIGDTPLDVDCAHAHGAIAVAVATGHYTVPELEATGADLVLETLEGLGLDVLAKLTPSPSGA